MSWAPAEVSADILFDDFNDGNADGWVFPYNSAMSQARGVWCVEDGVLVQYASTDGHAGLVEGLLLSDQVIESQVRTGGYVGVVLWYDQVVDGEWANYVAVNHNYQGGLWVHEFMDGNVYKTLCDSPWISSNTWFDLRVEADSASGNLAVYLDDEYMFTHHASISQRTGLSGVWSGIHLDTSTTSE